MPKVKTIATRQLNISTQRCTPGRNRRSTRSGRTMRVGAHQLAGDDHHRPDRDVDDHLLGPGDRRARGDVAAENLDRGDRHRAGAEHADQHALDPIPDAAMRARTRSAAAPGLIGASGADIRHDQLDQLRRHMRVGGGFVLLGQHLFAHRVGLGLADIDQGDAGLCELVAAVLLRLRGIRRGRSG